MKRTATDDASDFFKGRRRVQFFAEQRDDLFHALGGKPLLPLAEQFLFSRRDKKQFRRHFQGFRLIPNRLRQREHRRVAQAREQLLLAARQPRRRRDGGFFGLSGDDFAHERMQRRDEFAQVPPQEIE